MRKSSMQTQKASKLSLYLQQISNYSKLFGGISRPFTSLDQLYQVDEPALDNILEVIEHRYRALSSLDIHPNKRVNIQDEVFLFQEALKYNKLLPKDNVTQYFEFGDIIEIYNRDFVQIYGNLQFMRFCSYDLFTLYTTPFFKLYSRSKEYDIAIQEIMQKCFQGFEGTKEFSVPPHFLKEIYQKNNKIFKIHPKWISPLIDQNGDITACVLTNYCIETQMTLI